MSYSRAGGAAASAATPDSSPLSHPFLLLLQSGVRGAGFEFAHSDHLGYISASPSNLGTCLKANVMMRIPKFGDHPDFQSTLVRCPRRGWSHLPP